MLCIMKLLNVKFVFGFWEPTNKTCSSVDPIVVFIFKTMLLWLLVLLHLLRSVFNIVPE